MQRIKKWRQQPLLFSCVCTVLSQYLSDRALAACILYPGNKVSLAAAAAEWDLVATLEPGNQFVISGFICLSCFILDGH